MNNNTLMLIGKACIIASEINLSKQNNYKNLGLSIYDNEIDNNKIMIKFIIN